MAGPLLPHEPPKEKRAFISLSRAAELGERVGFWAAPSVTRGWLGVFQDVDAAYANKVELQAKVDSMDQDIKFFKCLYEAVSLSLQPIL
jgi:hypothetical protein